MAGGGCCRPTQSIFRQAAESGCGEGSPGGPAWSSSGRVAESGGGGGRGGQPQQGHTEQLQTMGDGGAKGREIPAGPPGTAVGELLRIATGEGESLVDLIRTAPG